MVKCLNGRWFLEVTTTTGRVVRIAVDQIAVINDDGQSTGIVTNTGFIAAVPLQADTVWTLLLSIVPASGALND